LRHAVGKIADRSVLDRQNLAAGAPFDCRLFRVRLGGRDSLEPTANAITAKNRTARVLRGCEALTYAGAFSEAAGDTLALTGGALTLIGANDAFSGGAMDGSKLLYTEGTTAVSGLTIGGTVEWENTNAVNESGGSATIGDAIGDEAILYNAAKATYDILDNSGIGLGASMASLARARGRSSAYRAPIRFRCRERRA
jgi:hypothetical protein